MSTPTPSTPKGLQRVEHHLNAIVTGSHEQRVSALKAIRNLSIQPSKRRDLASFSGFVEVICTTLLDHVEESQVVSALCVEIIKNLVLEHPVIDHQFVMEPSCLTSMSKLLVETDSEDVQLNVLAIVDYLSILEMHQTAVCGEDGLVSSVCEFLVHENAQIRDHALMTIQYLSSNPKNKFIMARTDPILSKLTECLEFDDMQSQILFVLDSLASCEDNVPVLARDDQLMMMLVQLLNSGNDEVVDDVRKVLEQLSNDESLNSPSRSRELQEWVNVAN
ncbi:hypothetical protein P9112_013076 [Eukaryota sp. TZLM1-RC]